MDCRVTSQLGSGVPEVCEDLFLGPANRKTKKACFFISFFFFFFFTTRNSSICNSSDGMNDNSSNSQIHMHCCRCLRRIVSHEFTAVERSSEH